MKQLKQFSVDALKRQRDEIQRLEKRYAETSQRFAREVHALERVLFRLPSSYDIEVRQEAPDCALIVQVAHVALLYYNKVYHLWDTRGSSRRDYAEDAATAASIIQRWITSSRLVTERGDAFPVPDAWNQTCVGSVPPVPPLADPTDTWEYATAEIRPPR